MKYIAVLLLAAGLSLSVWAGFDVEKLRADVATLRAVVLSIEVAALPGDADDSDTQRGAVAASNQTLLTLQEKIKANDLNLDVVKNEVALVLQRLYLVEEGLLRDKSRESLLKGRELALQIINVMQAEITSKVFLEKEAAQKAAVVAEQKRIKDEAEENARHEDAGSISGFCRRMDLNSGIRACVQITSRGTFYKTAMTVCRAMDLDSGRIACLEAAVNSRFADSVTSCRDEFIDSRRIRCMLRHRL